MEGTVFAADDWGGYARCIPENQLFTGKDLTFPIEQDNSNTRHFLARFHRKTKASSRSVAMVDGAIALNYALKYNGLFEKLQQNIQAILK